jgi:hypothetical protein
MERGGSRGEPRQEVTEAGRAGRVAFPGSRLASDRPHQSWQPETRRDDLAQHCAAFSGAQQAFFLVSIFIEVS